MRRSLHPLLLALILAIPAPALAQEQEGLVWATASTSIPVEQGLSVDVEFTARFGDEGRGLYETLQFLYLTKSIGSDTQVSIGYQRNDSNGREPGLVENRLRQRITGPIADIGGGQLRYALQLEQRFRNDGTDEHYRARPRIFYRLPLDEDGDTQLSLSHESFIGTKADWTSQSGWFRLRNQAVVRTPLVARVNIDVGYMLQYDFARSGGRDLMSHAALVGLVFTP